MTTYNQSVLLVGRGFIESPAAIEWFLRRRRECRTASTLGEVRAIDKARIFDLILTDYHLPDGTGFALLDRFRGHPVSLFLSHRVENGSIWLPGILRGVRCWGDAALNPQAFVRLLIDIISGNTEVAGVGNYQY